MEFITIKIWTGSAAFDESPTMEIARVLREIADEIESDGHAAHYRRDINGNVCGEVEILRAGE